MKKLLKSLISILITCAVILGIRYLFTSDTVKDFLQERAEKDLPTQFTDKKPMSTYYFDKLSEKQQRAYICIFNEVRSHPQKIQIPSVSSDEIERIFQYIKYDNPDIFCLNETCYLITESAKTYFSAEYDCSADKCRKYSEQTISKAKEITDEIIASTESFYERELMIHDYIVDNCTYKKSDFDSTAYGCLINNEAVCSGYANAAMIMLNMAGIKTVVIPGDATPQNGKTEGHLWNMVELDGEQYFLDVTWDDPDFEDSSSPSHMYFNVTESFISVTHSDFDANSVHCTGTKYNYFVYNNLIFDKYDYTITDVIIDYCINEIENGHKSVEFMFTSDAYDNAKKMLFDDSNNNQPDIRKIIFYVSSAAEGAVSSNRVSYIADDTTYSVRLFFE